MRTRHTSWHYHSRIVWRHRHRAHHRTLFNRKGYAAPHCFVQAFTGLLAIALVGSHSSRGAPVGTHSSRVAGNSCGKYPHPLPPAPLPTCNGSTPGLHGVQIGLHGWRARARAPLPHKNPMTRVYPFHVARHVHQAAHRARS